MDISFLCQHTSICFLFPPPPPPLAHSPSLTLLSGLASVTHTHTHTRAHAHTHRHTCWQENTNTRTHTHTHTRCVGELGLFLFFGSRWLNTLCLFFHLRLHSVFFFFFPPRQTEHAQWLRPRANTESYDITTPLINLISKNQEHLNKL